MSKNMFLATLLLLLAVPALAEDLSQSSALSQNDTADASKALSAQLKTTESQANVQHAQMQNLGKEGEISSATINSDSQEMVDPNTGQYVPVPQWVLDVRKKNKSLQ